MPAREGEGEGGQRVDVVRQWQYRGEAYSDNAQWQLGQLAERTEHGYGCGDEEDELGLLGAEEARVDVSQHGGAQSKVALHQAHGYASAFARKQFHTHG